MAGVLLLVWQLRRTGLDQVELGLRQVGWGFLGILVLSLVRFTLRSIAWTTLTDVRGATGAAVGATLAGDAIGNLTPLSLLVSEPVKSMYLRHKVPVSRSFPALAAENFFYSASVAVYIILGTVAMLQEFSVPGEVKLAGVIAIALMTAVLASALWIGWREPALFSGVLTHVPIPAVVRLLDRVRRFESSTYRFLRQTGRPVGVVLACETAFHIVSFAEAAFTIWLLTGRWHLLAAFVFDAFNRVVNVVFRPIPMRIGVDEVGTGILAPALGLTTAAGVTLALVRKGRMFAWAAVGITLAIRKGLRFKDVVNSGQ